MSDFEIAVYDRTDLQTPVTYVPRYRSPLVLEERNRDGGGSFQVRLDDPTYLEHREAFVEGNYVRMALPGKVLWFEIQRPGSTTIDEDQNLWLTVAGPGPLAWTRNAIVYPAVGQIAEPMTRRFNFATAAGSWFRPAEWGSPVVVGTAGGTNPWGSGYPNEWRVPGVAWVWDRDTTNADAPAGDVYLRREFTVSGTRRTLRLWAAVADVARVYIDGVPVMSVTEFGAHQRTFTTDVELPAGSHVIGVHAVKQNAGKAAVAIALTEVPAGTNDVITPEERLVWTGQAGWLMQAYPAVQPGWTPGLVVATLFNEARSRGVEGLSRLTLGFSGTLDSLNAPWVANVDYAVGVGSKVRDFLSSVVESAADVWVSDELRLCAAPERGVDRSVGDAPVLFAYGHNVLKASAAPSDETIVNRMLVNTATGLMEVEAPDGSVARYGRREEYLSVTSASKNGTAPRLVQQVWDRRAQPRRNPTVAIFAREGSTPWVDFAVGDWVLAPSDDDRDTSVRRRVVSISASEDAATGRTVYEIEVDSIAQTADERVARWLTRNDGGALGGEISTGNSSEGALVQVPGPGSTPSSTDPTLLQVPQAPGTVEVVASAYIDESGTPVGEVLVSWAAVTQDTRGAPVQIDSYEVWGRKTSGVSDNDWRSMGFVTTTSARIGGFGALSQWEFRVRALARTSSIPSAFSGVASVTIPEDDDPPPAPSAPVVTTRLGTLTVVWDGLTVSAAHMPPDFHHIDVWLSPTEAGEGAVVGSLRGSSGEDLVVLTGLTYTEPVWVWMRAVDRSGNVSTPSEKVSMTVKRVEGPDLEANSVTANAIAAGAVVAEKIDAGAVTAVKIAAGAVTAVKIDANAVTADKIAADAVTATKIAAGAVVADKIAAGAVVAEKIALSVYGTNVVENSGFERLGIENPPFAWYTTAPGWSIDFGAGTPIAPFRYGVYPQWVHSGRGLAMLAGGPGLTFGTSIWGTKLIPCSPGETYRASVWAARVTNPNTPNLQVAMLFFADEVSSAFSTVVLRNWAPPAGTPGQLVETFTVPAGAAFMRIRVSAYGLNQTGDSEALVVDDVVVARSGAPGMEITGASIRFWNSAGQETLLLDGENGRLRAMQIDSDAGLRVTSAGGIVFGPTGSDISIGYSTLGGLQQMYLRGTYIELGDRAQASNIGGNTTVNGYLTTRMPTTTGSANVFSFATESGPGLLQKVSSLRRYKVDRESIDARYEILDLPAVTWRDRAQVEADPDVTRRIAGFIAEDLEALSEANDGVFDALLSREDDGALQGITYDRVLAYVLPVLRDMNRRLTNLEEGGE